ncbi:MAG: excinuclease ABC subunit UvrA [Bacteroidetes bacterium]|nr:excinuclease ABC subunit UvrA [Bacteroidota bacterium]
MPENHDPKKFIIIKGARVHNLKNIDVVIPRNKLVVITGLSGSGKSSLAFDTIYAEGQRRYVESLSSYARQFLGRIDKPDVDYIKGLSPSIAIEQKVTTKNSRSSVGSSTEIAEYLRILFARIGKTYSPESGKEVKKHNVQDVIHFIKKHKEKRGLLLAPVSAGESSTEDFLKNLIKEGFERIKINAEIVKTSEVLTDKALLKQAHDVAVVIDRFSASEEEDFLSQIEDSIQTAFQVGNGFCEIEIHDNNKIISEKFSNVFEADGIKFTEPNPHFFNPNSPLGACPTCEGFGQVLGISEDLVIPNPNLSVYEDAVACWKGEKMSEWKIKLINNAEKADFPIHRPYNELSEKERNLLWNGCKHFKGIHQFFQYVESKLYKIQYRVMLARYRGRTNCMDCKGTKLRKEASWVKINNKNVLDLMQAPIHELQSFFENISLHKNDAIIAKRLLEEIKNRLRYLMEVGLGYLTLSRPSHTLSGGESQRIHLATSLGSSLVGSMYVLDEPSIGLHSRDTQRLIKVLKSLRDLGNTVIVVEHDPDIMKEADYLIDIGPMAGINGGEIVFAGTHKELLSTKKSLTTQYLTGKLSIPTPKERRKWKYKVLVEDASMHNVQKVNVELPLEILTVITGVSGSGKSTLIQDIAYKEVLNSINKIPGGKNGKVSGDIHRLKGVEFIDQNPIGKSSRSNPVTFLKAYDDIRNIFSELPLCKARGYKPSHFSFNVDGGRCEKCEGEGTVTISMQFMADVNLLCDECNGKRFKDEILEVKYRDKNINDILNLTVDEALIFFKSNAPKEGRATPDQKIVNKILPLQETGLGYITLGQSSSTLSGGEAQRIKLASFLAKGAAASSTLFIFDEPTTGLHIHDIRNLLLAFQQLIENGNSLWLIEHNMEVIKCADWIIDVGPDGGEDGGQIVFQGTPEEMVKKGKTYTSDFLKQTL